MGSESGGKKNNDIIEIKKIKGIEGVTSINGIGNEIVCL